MTSKPSSAASSPGLFSAANIKQRSSGYISEGTPLQSPYLHPLQVHKVREYV